MQQFLGEGFSPAEVRLSHELANITDKNLVNNAVANEAANRNATLMVLEEILAMELQGNRLTLVTPYPFLARYENKQGELLLDEAAYILEWLKEHPHVQLDIITNSPASTGNFTNQAVVDMDTAPRLLLDRRMRKKWLKAEDELAIGNSKEWQSQIANARVRIYEVGRGGVDLLPGGKLHGKFFVGDSFGYVGSTNLDYRSRLNNNEMGYFFHGRELADQLWKNVELLKADAYLWGSPEWLEMRAELGKKGGSQGFTTRNQRTIYKTLQKTGLIWQM